MRHRRICRCLPVGLCNLRQSSSHAGCLFVLPRFRNRLLVCRRGRIRWYKFRLPDRFKRVAFERVAARSTRLRRLCAPVPGGTVPSPLRSARLPCTVSGHITGIPRAYRRSVRCRAERGMNHVRQISSRRRPDGMAGLRTERDRHAAATAGESVQQDHAHQQELAWHFRHPSQKETARSHPYRDASEVRPDRL